MKVIQDTIQVSQLGEERVRQPITLSWDRVSASVGEKRILYDCHGVCRPGEMLAIMGPSGAGKTTLLSNLSGKADSMIQNQGEILANGELFNASSFYNFGAYIYQNDILHETLTVRETIEFAGVLKFKDPQVARLKVEKLIDEFELQRCVDTQVGGPTIKGISGGEKKRVCIAVEMISEPSLLILDEPTSGLDSNKAGKVLKVLRRLVAKGCTVVFTIHQPSYLLYSMLDKLILLDKGLTIYQGPAQAIINYMAKLGLQLPVTSTVCDYFMLEISEYKAQKQNYKTPLNYQTYHLYLQPVVRAQIKSSKGDTRGYDILKVATSFSFMFFTLLKRQLTIYRRNKQKFAGTIINAITGMIIVGFFYLNQIPTPETLLQIGQSSDQSLEQLTMIIIGVQGVSYVNTLRNVMNGIFAVVLAFPVDRQIYCKECSSKKYTPLSYFLSKILVEIGNAAVGSILFAAAAYWMNGYQATVHQFILFIVAMIMMSLFGNGLGFLTGSLFQDPKRAAALSTFIVLPMFAFSGIYNKLNDMPKWTSWLQYLSPFRFGLHMILDNQYGDLLIPIGQTGKSYDYQSDLGITLDYTQCLVVVAAVAFGFYLISFVFLRQRAAAISV